MSHVGEWNVSHFGVSWIITDMDSLQDIQDIFIQHDMKAIKDKAEDLKENLVELGKDFVKLGEDFEEDVKRIETV